MKNYKNNKETIIIGHRGASGLVRYENTIEAFQKAIELGIDAIECDVRKTKDDILIINHNPDISSVLISDHTYFELEEICNSLGYHLPTLKETITYCKNKIILDIEIKEIGYEEQIYSIINDVLHVDEYYIRSFFDSVIIKFKQINKNIQTILLLGIGKNSNSIKTRLSEIFPKKRIMKTNCDFVSPHYKLIPFGVVKRIHKLGKKAIVWTVNTKEIMQKCKKNKCDGIITNFPNIALEVFSK